MLLCREEQSRSSAALQSHGLEVLFQPQHGGILISTHLAMVHPFLHKVHYADWILKPVFFSSKQTKPKSSTPAVTVKSPNNACTPI